MFKTIVVAHDGSEGAERAVPVAVELAKRDGAKLILAHADERTIGKGGGELRADEPELQQKLARQAEELSGQGIEASLEARDVMVGGPASVIAEIAKDADADLIVIGTRGHTAIAGLVLGGVTHRLLHISSCPVLAVPSG